MPKTTASDHVRKERASKIVSMIPPGAPGFAEAKGGSMVVSSPAEVDRLIRRLKVGEILTLNDIRNALALKYEVAVTCPVSTAIFVNMAARAAEEQRALGVSQEKMTPWWRVLKNGGFLNPKYPGGVEYQAKHLALEGVRCSPLRKQLAVFDFAERRPDFLNR